MLCCVFFPRAGSAVAIAVAAATTTSGRSNCRCNKPTLTSSSRTADRDSTLGRQHSSLPETIYNADVQLFGAAGTAFLCFYPAPDQFGPLSMRAKNPHQQSRSTRNSQPTMLPVPIVFDLVMHFFRKNGLTFAASRHAFPSNFFSVEDPGRTIVLPQTMSPRWRTCLRCHHQRLRPGRPVYG